MENNPWTKLLSKESSYFLQMDQNIIIKNNNGIDKNSNGFINLSYLPEPFIGNVNAPIYFLMANPGRITNNEDQKLNTFTKNKSFVNIILANLNHQYDKYPFYYLDPSLTITDTYGYDWWNRCLNPIIKHLNIDRQIFASNFFALEIYGYHTRKFNRRVLNKKMRLPSIDYSISLIQNAINAHKLILIGRSVNCWFNLIPTLENYDNCYFVANNRQMELSRTTIPPRVINEIRNIFRRETL